MRHPLRPISQLVFCMALGCSGRGDELDGPTRADPPAGCGSRSVSTAISTGYREPVPVEGSQCGAVIREEEVGGFDHVSPCSPVTYSTNPPSSGMHYPSWAAYRVYERAVARGFWVHSLEHGGVAFLHNCDDCDDDIAAARSLIDELPEDRLCYATRNRMLMTHDPLLDVPWAAAAWGFTLRSKCFEPEVFRAFVDQRYGRGRENTCAEGQDF